MTKSTVALTVMLPLLNGCTSNRHVIRDERGEIAGAFAWKPQFGSKDSSPGIAIEFIKPQEEELESIDSTQPMWRHRVRVRRSSLGGPPKYVAATLWHYPIDSVVQVSTFEESVPSTPLGIPELSETIDVTRIQYRINQDPIHFNLEVHLGQPCSFSVPLGTYLLRCEPYGFYPRWIKDVTVKQDSLSIVKIDTVAVPPPVLY